MPYLPENHDRGDELCILIAIELETNFAATIPKGTQALSSMLKHCAQSGPKREY